MLHLAHEVSGDARSFLQGHAVIDPLPHLRPRDLCGCRVLHEVVDRRCACPTKPRGDVLDADAHVRPQARLGDRPARDSHVEQLFRRGVDLGALAVELVLFRSERTIELTHRGLHQVGVRDPRSIEAICRFALLVVADLRERRLGDRRIASIRDESGHTAKRERAALVAGLHEELGVRAHERHCHRHLRAVWQDELLPVAELLDDAEHVVPAPRVQPRAVIAELVERLLHLERER